MEFMLTVDKLLQPENTLSRISVTLEGMSTLVNDVHPLKALSPISVTVEGMVIPLNDVHPLKAPPPIEVTLFMVTDVSTVLSLHTPSGKDVTLSANTTSTASLGAFNLVLALTLRFCVTPSVFVYLP